jgi:hypothetical protein
VRLVVPLRPRNRLCRIDFLVRPAPLLSIPPGSQPIPYGATFAFE